MLEVALRPILIPHATKEDCLAKTQPVVLFPSNMKTSRQDPADPVLKQTLSGVDKAPFALLIGLLMQED